MINLQTERLILRNFLEADLTDFLEYQALPEVRKYMQGVPISEEQAKANLAKQSLLAEKEKNNWHGFALQHIADDKVIGDIGYFYRAGEKEEADIGFQLHPSYHGKGYAFEATSALLEFLFTELPILVITSNCHKDNEASYKLMKKLGLQLTSASETSVSYAITRDGWLAKQL